MVCCWHQSGSTFCLCGKQAIAIAIGIAGAKRRKSQKGIGKIGVIMDGLKGGIKYWRENSHFRAWCCCCVLSVVPEIKAFSGAMELRRKFLVALTFSSQMEKETREEPKNLLMFIYLSCYFFLSFGFLTYL